MTQKEEFKRALEILEEIEENVGVCCAVTMEPDEVLVLIDKLKEILEKFKDE
jgi:3-deoxy-D-arabino-heptulosonate 7-phosphate (DAHP) synthase class II